MKSSHLYWAISNLWLMLGFFSLLIQPYFQSLEAASIPLVASLIFFTLNLCLGIRAHYKEYRD